jgi:Antenna complex alpha/beta subunit
VCQNMLTFISSFLILAFEIEVTQTGKPIDNGWVSLKMVSSFILIGASRTDGGVRASPFGSALIVVPNRLPIHVPVVPIGGLPMADNQKIVDSDMVPTEWRVLFSNEEWLMHRIVVYSTYGFLVIALIAHTLVYAARPWLPNIAN